jgi:hypothetical protein
MNVPSMAPPAKEGEKMEKMRERFEGWEISEARILTITPAGLRPTANV